MAAPAAAPEPDAQLLARAKRAVGIRLRQKLEKGAQPLRDPLAFSRWYLRHLLEHPEEIDELEELERIRDEIVAKATRAALPDGPRQPFYDVGKERAELAKQAEEARRRRNRG